MAFDGIVTKALASELQGLCNARIDKIFQPNKNSVILGFYLDGLNYALNICADSQYYRINLTTHSKSNPKIAPNFCMVLRKHLLSLRIKNVITSNLERVVTIEFEGFDDIDDIISKKLVIELMGKHCNIILLNDNNIIIDSLRHINNEGDDEDSASRSILPHIKYMYPNTNKYNFMEVTDYEQFKKLILKFISSDLQINTNNTNNLQNKIANFSLDDLYNVISNNFNGISKSFVKASITKLGLTEINDNSLEMLFNYINTVVSNTDNQFLKFETIFDKENNAKDYFLTPSTSTENLSLNFFIDDFYYSKETSNEFKIYRNSVLKLILDALKKYKKRLSNINQKLKECDNMDIYRIYGELITANLYRLPNHNVDSVDVENYYDNNNLLSIPLDKKYSISINAKRFFKKYNKLKNALEIVSIQKEDTNKELDYIESIVYELEAATNIEEVSDIFEEISENVIFKEKTNSYKNKKKSKIKKSKLTKNKTVSFNPIKYKIDDYTLLVGRNNKENDYLTLKYAKKSDLWFHTKDIHGSHAILFLENGKRPNNDILIRCAEIAAFHSKAKDSSNVPVNVCEVRFVKKPNGAKPGMVIYSNNETLNVQPCLS